MGSFIAVVLSSICLFIGSWIIIVERRLAVFNRVDAIAGYFVGLMFICLGIIGVIPNLVSLDVRCDARMGSVIAALFILAFAFVVIRRLGK